MTRRVTMSPIPMTIQLSISVRSVLKNSGRASPGRTAEPAVPTQAPPTKNKGRTEPAFAMNFKSKLLLGGDRVLRGFGDAELHDGLRLDLDGFAGLRVASDASLAVRLHETAEAGNNEDAVLLGFFDGGIGELLQKCRRGFIGKLSLLGEMPNQLCLCQTCCHSVISSTEIGLIPAGPILYPGACGKHLILQGFFNLQTRESAFLQGFPRA